MATQSMLKFLLAVIPAAGAAVAGSECGASVCEVSKEQLLLQVKGTDSGEVVKVSEQNVESSGSSPLVGYPGTEVHKAVGLWCEVAVPPENWSLSCPTDQSTTVKVLSYNLFWWNLFSRHHGGHKSAGRLIAQTSDPEYDFMGFQECDDRERVIADAKASGLQGSYATLDGGRAIAIAYLTPKWTLLSHGTADVGEDSVHQYYGKRSAMWARLRDQQGKTVLFVNHHGPLKPSEGGGCTGSATAMNILHLIGATAHADDAVILVGDFNANPHSTRIQRMQKHLTRVHSGHAMGGIDHVFSNCGNGAQGKTLKKGAGFWKSDHNAISATIKV